MPQEICDRAVNGARKLGPHWPIARINPALKLQPRETPLKQLLFLIYARCDYVIKLEQSCALLAPFYVVFAGVFVPVPPKKKAMRTVLVLPKTTLGEGKGDKQPFILQACTSGAESVSGTTCVPPHTSCNSTL